MTSDEFYAILDLHLAELRRQGKSKSTLEKRNRRVRQVTEALGPFPLRQDVELWLDGLGYGLSTVGECIIHITSFYRWAVEEEYFGAEAMPLLKLKPPALGKKLPRPMPDNMLEIAIVRAPKMVKAFILLGAFAGMRTQEMAGLQAEDISFEQKMIRVSHPKGGHERMVPLHPEVWAALVKYGIPKSGPVFQKADGTSVSPNYVSYRLSEYFHSLGITSSAHTLRHWYATRLLASTHDLRIVGAALGHRNINSTLIYADWDRQAAQAGVWSLQIPNAKGKVRL
jgi:site-specific recombinase XerD